MLDESNPTSCVLTVEFGGRNKDFESFNQDNSAVLGFLNLR